MWTSPCLYQRPRWKGNFPGAPRRGFSARPPMCHKTLMNTLRNLGAAALLALAGCGQKIFYYPNRVLYADPDRLGIASEIVYYPTANGNRLMGLYFPAKDPKGTVVHFHGNFANVSNHFPASYFLVKRGFNLLVFDYQGF